jgi:hypothetical protein
MGLSLQLNPPQHLGINITRFDKKHLQGAYVCVFFNYLVGMTSIKN